MYLYGAGGHAKVIIEMLEAEGIQVEGLVDDNPDLTDILSYPVYHGMESYYSPMIVSIGNNEIRKRIAEQLDVEFSTAIHPSAIVSPRATIGEGTVIMPKAVVNVDACIGKHCIINTAASIDHECKIGDYAHISPNVALCGNVTVGEGTQIGVGACVVPGIKIGKWSLVCAGSVVTRDLPDYCIASGNRCKVIKFSNSMNINKLDKVNRGGVKHPYPMRYSLSSSYQPIAC